MILSIPTLFSSALSPNLHTHSLTVLSPRVFASLSLQMFLDSILFMRVCVENQTLIQLAPIDCTNSFTNLFYRNFTFQHNFAITWLKFQNQFAFDFINVAHFEEISNSFIAIIATVQKNYRAILFISEELLFLFCFHLQLIWFLSKKIFKASTVGENGVHDCYHLAHTQAQAQAQIHTGWPVFLLLLRRRTSAHIHIQRHKHKHL